MVPESINQGLSAGRGEAAEVKVHRWNQSEQSQFVSGQTATSVAPDEKTSSPFAADKIGLNSSS